MTQIGLYIHIPFCIQKCLYCDFVSITNLSIVKSYINALLQEIQLKSSPDFQINSIYFGGGTPSVLSANHIIHICQWIYKLWNIVQQPEVSIEVNPGTISHDKIHAWQISGINRINIGVQSFHDHHLKLLGRIHTVKQALHAIDCLKDAGFNNIGFDLMYGLPGQTLHEWRTDLETAIVLNPKHMSCYSLTFESGTQFYEMMRHKRIVPLSEKIVRQMMHILMDIMAENRYDHYEISNFASQKIYRSRHNQKYWNHQPYIGLGVAAHSFINNKRFWNCSHVSDYIYKLHHNNDPTEHSEILTREQQLIEWIFLGLRQKEGILIDKFEQHFSCSFHELFSSVLDELKAIGYIHVSPLTCCLTDAGRFYLNSIVQKMVDSF
ncbi:MAG: oxygen-independent coproporphyrinogen III oxidase [Candidatus Magnetoglobus multicellularis str. Araruama]|uniref:Heme chaperone HemW n=1 Tax=Candidatus Magnetoglobus multicellularis str. Araruama TaxID=890399 RepID=A0A1V1PB69_9BACT|nr:MAG: oxygen-independent coproporphyrinogen III oxidase [Candidatus Magnetoglobus multicellularis str. Araruama]